MSEELTNLATDDILELNSSWCGLQCILRISMTVQILDQFARPV
jgi:hypothetical protein